MDDGPVDALRVSQLDAAELDEEVVHLTKSQFSQIFKYHQSGFLARFDPEINAAIKLILWKFALRDQNATVGQQILGIFYTKHSVKDAGPNHSTTSTSSPSSTPSSSSSSYLSITSRDKTLYALLVVIFPWLKERLSTLLSYIGLSSWETDIEYWLQHAENAFKMASLINLLVFLKRGVYISVVERLLGIQSRFPNRQALRQVGFEYMTREILWHGFSEFLFFLLPLINFQRLRNIVTRRFLGQRSVSQGHLKHRTRADLMSCVVCHEWPTMPREIGCRHVFCYYCVAANMQADSNFSCPDCGHPVVSPSNIQTVKSHVNPDHPQHQQTRHSLS